MKYRVWIVFCLFTAVAASAQTYSNANLNGTYSFQFGSPVNQSWSKTFTCPTNSAITYFLSGGITTTNVSYGTLTFDGNGNGSLATTFIGDINLTATLKTMSVTWNSACKVTASNPGHIVYAAATKPAFTGTYTVASNGTGSIKQTGSTGQYLTFVLAATNASGISTELLLTNSLTNGQNIGTGLAVHQ